MVDSKNKEKGEGFNNYSLASPRFWHGMTTPVWWHLLASHGFRISPQKAHHWFGVGLFTPFNDAMALTQHLLHGRRIAQTELAGPPLFILGHWRSGTTYLHELLQLDQRYASPNTFQCFAPWHFLLSEKLACRFFQFLLPEQRPMDNMKAGWELPQEDEFALMNLGAATHYTRIAFPSDPYPEDKPLSEKELAYWKSCLDWFMRALTYHYAKPLVMKSPPHTGRIGILAEMYPQAKFIHIVRDPRKLFPSTVRLWNALDHFQSLQIVKDPNRIESFVLESHKRMYRHYHAHAPSIPSNRLIEIHYEKLVEDPVASLQSIYDQLELGQFQQVRSRIADRKQADQNYKTNQFKQDGDLEKRILEEWHDYAARYGYLTPTASA